MTSTRSILLPRTKNFALAVIRLYAALPKTVVAEILGKQVLRSATSVGAHVHEGKRSRSIAEMISKTEVALQEIEETGYWLELLAASETVRPEAVQGLITEVGELTAMLVSSAKSLKSRLPPTGGRSRYANPHG